MRGIIEIITLVVFFSGVAHGAIQNDDEDLQLEDKEDYEKKVCRTECGGFVGIKKACWESCALIKPTKPPPSGQPRCPEGSVPDAASCCTTCSKQLTPVTFDALPGTVDELYPVNYPWRDNFQDKNQTISIGLCALDDTCPGGYCLQRNRTFEVLVSTTLVRNQQDLATATMWWQSYSLPSHCSCLNGAMPRA